VEGEEEEEEKGDAEEEGACSSVERANTLRQILLLDSERSSKGLAHLAVRPEKVHDGLHVPHIDRPSKIWCCDESATVDSSMRTAVWSSEYVQLRPSGSLSASGLAAWNV
jgi:hypothetical protein